MEKQGKLAFLNPKNDQKRILFYCVGCKGIHGINETWQWNGDTERPTFAPSVLVTMPGIDEYRCHSFVRDGRIEYLSDCSHELAGQTVEMVDFP